MRSHELEPGLIIAERYRVLRLIGEGGMGSVYLVEHLKTDERFALKVLNAKGLKNTAAQERFRREARTPARIDSDHVVRVVDSDVAAELGDAPFIVMEFLRGRSLEDLSDELGPLSPTEVLTYMRQVAITLDRAHAIGVVHRDLKPENLFLTTRDDGTPCVKVLDFGIAKLSGATGDLARVKATGTGEVFGTPMYMSPEQCKSEADRVGPATDVWSFGLIAHRLLTGEDFWRAGTLVHLVAQISYEPIPKPSAKGHDFGSAYDEWFLRCCARDPEQRFGSATEAMDALAHALGVPDALRSSATGRGPLRAAALASAQAAQASSPGLGKQTASGLTRTDPAVGQTRLRRRGPRWGLLTAIAAGTALGVVLAVAWFGGALWGTRGDTVPAAEDTVSTSPEPTAETATSSVEQATAPTADESADGGVDAGVEAGATATATSPPPPPTARPPIAAPPRPLPTKPTAEGPADPLSDRF